MTIEQLLCPAVIQWESNFRKQLKESHIEMTDDEISKEFDKWLVENEEIINKSVEDNIDRINETINRNMKKIKSLNEGIFGDDEFNDDDDDDEKTDNEIEDEPISGISDDTDEKTDPDEPITTSITGAVKLVDKKDSKYNIFGFINDFYDMVVEEKETDGEHTAIMKKLDVSSVTDMAALFAFTELPNLNLSSWDTSRVKTMEGMFYKSTFNNDSICHWDVSSCPNFKNMFLFCPFNHSLKYWTPGFIKYKERDSDGAIVDKGRRADLPILGSTEDENKNQEKKFRRKLFKSMIMDENKMIHIVDFDTFVNEGKVKDFLHKGVEKIKNVFKSISLKIGKFIASFGEDGEMIPAVSAYTSLNVAASGEIQGVSAFCAVNNDNLVDVPKVADIADSSEYYGIIDKDDIEYKNYKTFVGMLNEHYEKYGDTGAFQILNEDDNSYNRVGFSAESGGVRARDINSKRMKEILIDAIKNVPAYKGKNHGGPVFIWGAPGIGKSTIPKTIIKEWNENVDEFHKKGLMVVECGDLTIDGFALPVPIEKTIGETLKERPKLSEILNKSGIPEDKMKEIENHADKVAIDVIKTWLPVFKASGSKEEVNTRNNIANGYVSVDYNTDGTIETNESTEGGILLFDEFFRANEQIFKILMQLLLNRTYAGYTLGNKWAILCCSNRPNDDEEVAGGFEKTGAVVGTRMLAGAYNFIPSFEDWKSWAIKDGGFDELTIEFLMFDEDSNGEYTNWHTIRPDEYTSTGKTAWPTPRTWAALINELHLYMENHGYSNITEIPQDIILEKGEGIIGEEMAGRYANFIKSRASEMAVNFDEIMNNPDYIIPESSKVSDVARQIENSIRVKYSSDDIPTSEQMMNIFNKLNDTYPSSKDNFIKMMHVNIIKYFDVMKNKENKMNLKEYLQAVDSRYNLEAKDLK